MLKSFIDFVLFILHNYVLSPGRGASQVRKSRLNWATQFLTVAYDGVCSSNVSVTMA
jgi:hypothetical protein